MEQPDRFGLRRFVEAQEPVIETALAELRRGRKESHWMWFVFPQLAALGRSATAVRFGLRSLAEARSYLAHPVLGPRLTLCTDTVLRVPDRTLTQIFGSPDDLKFRSCMTLFDRAAEGPAPFSAALDRFCGGAPDPRTLELLEDQRSP